jgi:hypothetical protein
MVRFEIHAAAAFLATCIVQWCTSTVYTPLFRSSGETNTALSGVKQTVHTVQETDKANAM